MTPVDYQESPPFQNRSPSGGTRGQSSWRLGRRKVPAGAIGAMRSPFPKTHLKTNSMFLQLLKDLHGGFRLIGVTEIRSGIHLLVMTGALREKPPNAASDIGAYV